MTNFLFPPKIWMCFIEVEDVMKFTRNLYWLVRGGSRDARPSSVPFFFNFMQFSRNNGQNNRLIAPTFGVCAPLPSEKSWFRHWFGCTVLYIFLLSHIWDLGIYWHGSVRLLAVYYKVKLWTIQITTSAMKFPAQRKEIKKHLYSIKMLLSEHIKTNLKWEVHGWVDSG